MEEKPVLPEAGSPLLPTVGEPGTYEWCEEVVECMNDAWRAKETNEASFFAAVKAAIEYRIWETLSPSFPEEPYASLESLIRRKADPGQAENMQIAIRFGGLAEGVTPEAGSGEPPWAAGGSVAASGPTSSPASVALPTGDRFEEFARKLAEHEEVAMGNALLDQFGAQAAALGLDPSALASALSSMVGSSSDATAEPPAPVSPTRSAAQRKRDKLERLFPELMESVEAGEMTLKQAYVQAGIEKPPQTVDKLQRLWRTATEDERDRFLMWLDEQIQKNRRREYEEQVYGEDQ